MSRGTGRTMATLSLALKLAREGKRVYLVAADQKHKRLLTLALGQQNNEIFIVTDTGGEIDWETPHIRGLSRDTVILFDHHAYEQKIWKYRQENAKLKEQIPRKEDLVLLMKFASQAMGGWPSDKDAYDAMGRISEITRSL